MSLFELSHVMGGDLAADAVGALVTVTDSDRGKQRVLRRLLTNPGDYIWHTNYGAGLPQKIGQPYIPAELKALIRSQMLLEQCVAPSPAPQITITDLLLGRINIAIRYTDSTTGQPVLLTFDPSNPGSAQ